MFMLFIGLLINHFAASLADQEYGQGNNYPYWGKFHKTSVSEIRQAEWTEQDIIKEGWDWSLPSGVEPAPAAYLCIARNFGLGRDKIEQLPEIRFSCNPVISHWVTWSLLEPEEGKIDFQPLIDNIRLAHQKGYGSIVRLHFSAIDFAPEWIKKYHIPIRTEQRENPIKTNYEPGHPEFHKRYLKFIKALGESGIPHMAEVKGLFLGYASPSNGDEGIGPYPERAAGANDTIPHVIERLDTWAEACRGVEHKVFMGGLSHYGFSKGFGIRRGFVEMYLYHIPDEHIGQTLDANNYLVVDESNPVIAGNVFHGEENEEYSERWATAWRDFRFGHSTVSFPYRYFTSNLRLLQMRCNYLMTNDFSLLPEMLTWVGLELGRTVEDTPDTWCFLRESYIKKDGGVPVKNFERWLYQRDAPGYETTPAVKIDHAIQMWMVDPDRYYDYIARRGRKMGFDVDDRFFSRGEHPLAVKISYYDGVEGTLKLVYRNCKGTQEVPVMTTGQDMVKTATFFIHARMDAPGFEHDFDFELHSEEEVPVFFVRVIKNDENHA
jgi:hypothetical protein